MESKGLDKKKIAIIAAAVVVIAVVILVIVNMVKPKDSVKSTTMRLLRAIGEVSLIDNGETKTIMEDMRLADGNVITTGDKSLASIGLDDYKIVNLEENSSAEFRQDGKKLELDLLDGRLFFDVRKALDETESLDIKASNMIVGIRGTSGYVVKDKDDPNAQHLYITDGHVKVTIKDPQTGETKEVDVQYGQRLTIKKDENGNVTDVQVEDVPPTEWPAELAAEVASYEETFDRIVEATGFDKEVIMEIANGDSTVSYILELQEVIDPTPEPSPEVTSDPTPDPTDPPNPTVKLVEVDGDGTVPPPADGNGNGQLGDGDGTTNGATPTPSPVAPVSNDQDPGTGTGAAPTPTATPTTTPTAMPTQEPTTTDIPTPTTMPTQTTYTVSASQSQSITIASGGDADPVTKSFALSSGSTGVSSLNITQGEYNIDEAEVYGNCLKVTVNTSADNVLVDGLMIGTSDSVSAGNNVGWYSPYQGAYYIPAQMFTTADFASIGQFYFGVNASYVYTLSSSEGVTFDMAFTNGGSAEYTFYRTSEQNFTAEIMPFVSYEQSSPAYLLKVTVTLDEPLGASAGEFVQLLHNTDDYFPDTGTTAEVVQSFAVSMTMLDGNGQKFEGILNAGTVNQNCNYLKKVYLKVNVLEH